MPRYFFDLYNGHDTLDEEGDDLSGDAAVRQMAMDTLPQVAAEEIPADGDRRSFVVIARDEEGNAVYSATLSYVGVWLRKETR